MQGEHGGAVGGAANVHDVVGGRAEGFYWRPGKLEESHACKWVEAGEREGELCCSRSSLVNVFVARRSALIPDL